MKFCISFKTQCFHLNIWCSLVSVVYVISNISHSLAIKTILTIYSRSLGGLDLKFGLSSSSGLAGRGDFLLK